MAENTTEPPVTVTGEERPHPALRKLGRACIALVRWQRGELDRMANAPTTPSATGDEASDPHGRSRRSTATAPETDDAGDAGAAHG